MKTVKILLAMLVASSFALTGCNTIAGAGEDIKTGGEAIKDTARDVQNKM